MSTICRDTQLPGFSSFWSCSFIWCRPLLTVQTTFPGLLRPACSLDMPISWKNVCVCVCVFFFGRVVTFPAQDRVVWRLLTISDATTCIFGTAFTHLFHGRSYGRIWYNPRQSSDKNGNNHRYFVVNCHYKIGSAERDWSYLKLGLMLAEPPSPACSLDVQTWCIRQLFFWVKFWISCLQICWLL